MKLPSLITCVVLGTSFAASAQTATGPQQPTLKLEPDTSSQGALRELSLQPGSLREVVEQLTVACSKIAKERDSGVQPMPTLIYGPGAGEAKVAAPLHLTDMRVIDAIALIAAAAGCDILPIHGLPQEGDVDGLRVIGYRFVTTSAAALPSPTTGGDVSGGESGGGDQLAGIGVALEQKDGHIVVGQVIPGSPADRYHGFKPGDRILQVAEMGQAWVDITGLPLEKVAKMIRGEPRSSVRLAIDPISGGEVSQIFGGGGIYFVALEREKLNLTPPKSPIPKVAEMNVPDPYHVDLRLGGALIPQAKSVAPIKGPTPAASPDETDIEAMRIYALGSILSGSEQDMKMKEDDFKKLVTDALDAAGLLVGPVPQLYFHTQSRVLIAKTTARRHEIIEQILNALKENEALRTIPPKH